jgi:hypothetical protein
MNILKTTSIVAVSVIATLAVATIMGFQLTEITAQEATRPQYLYVEGVEITGVFKFREGEEVVPINVFTQTKGWDRSEPFIFTMQKIVGNTPYLHMHADESFLFRNSEVQKQDWNPFDVEIILATGPYAKRVFSYDKCFIDKYSVNTLRDNEEGYTNKGFAVVEDYILECRAMTPHNPSLDEMMATSEDEKAQTTSTLDLKEPYSTWADHFKYQKPAGSLQQ